PKGRARSARNSRGSDPRARDGGTDAVSALLCVVAGTRRAADALDGGDVTGGNSAGRPPDARRPAAQARPTRDCPAAPARERPAPPTRLRRRWRSTSRPPPRSRRWYRKPRRTTMPPAAAPESDSSGTLSIAVLTISDGVAHGEREDRSGDVAREMLAPLGKVT